MMFLNANLECRSDMCCTRLAEYTVRTKDAKRTQKTPSEDHRTTLSGYIFITKACIDSQKKSLLNRLNSNISSTCPHSMVSFGPQMASIGWRVWGTPVNFNGFRVSASLLHRRRSTEVNETLHDVWSSSAVVHYVYIFRGLLPPNGILPGA